MTPSQSLDDVLSDFIANQDMPPGKGAVEFSFERQEVRLRVATHPRHTDRLQFDAVLALPEPITDARLLRLLLQMNQASRLDHDWQIAIDREQRLLLHTYAPRAGMTSAQLQALLAQGVEQALALRDLIDATSISDTHAPQTSPERPTLASIRARGQILKGR